MKAVLEIVSRIMAVLVLVYFFALFGMVAHWALFSDAPANIATVGRHVAGFIATFIMFAALHKMERSL